MLALSVLKYQLSIKGKYNVILLDNLKIALVHILPHLNATLRAGRRAQKISSALEQMLKNYHKIFHYYSLSVFLLIIETKSNYKKPICNFYQ
jgi:hypothetical protein